MSFDTDVRKCSNTPDTPNHKNITKAVCSMNTISASSAILPTQGAVKYP